MSSTGVLVADVVTTITLDSRVDNVTVETDGAEIWFTTDGRKPDYQQDIAHRAPYGRSKTVPVTGQADPTVIKLRSRGTPTYTVTGLGGAAGASAADIDAAVEAAVAALVAAAPGALDTLNELAAALGDDANYASTVTTALATKVAASVLAGGGKGFVNHGATAGTARPSGYASVEWFGSVEPTNAVNGDSWVDTSA
jgi:hypothetical protein